MNDIDWSKYGRVQRQQKKPDVEISFRDVDGRIICCAWFPIDRLDEVIDKLRTQRDFWLSEKAGM
ncbi:hypothetical protein WJ24_27765 [Burkholderia vietnamiensis]|uniref:hypothetical protein n=1 Tax=Burkholderia vietnamiensis TaxID=60552 RepID=UPI0007579A49|nr:hypothetical protein [Burkholderia vietnamiensis]KVG05423.1 hypothetical protein WJ24_27765 [Burkholderia vietnamiensis]